MTPADFSAFAHHLGGVAVTLRESLTVECIEGYFAALADLPIEAIIEGCRRANRECTYFPKPAELRALAGLGAPDVGMVEALLCDHLRSAANHRKLPTDPFLCLVIKHLGGLRATAEFAGGQRIFALGRILPGVVAIAREANLPMPTAAQLSGAARAMAARSLEAAGERRELTYDEPPAGDTADRTRRGQTGNVADFLGEKLKRGLQ